MDTLTPFLAIRCLVYNHEPYLRQCLDGFVMQKTTFPFIAVVHDDASTDGSAAIIREYEEKYPHIIKPIYETENQYSKNDGTLERIVADAIPASVQYLAMCEGDDYWTDPDKLQRQVDFLETHEDIVVCSHRFQILEQDKGVFLSDNLSIPFQKSPLGYDFGVEENFACWSTQTMTVVFRNHVLDQGQLSRQYRHFRDVHLFYHMLRMGKGHCLPFVGAVYRRNTGGIYASLSGIDKSLIDLKVYNDLFRAHHDPIVKSHITSYIRGATRQRISLSEKGSVRASEALALLKYTVRYRGIRTTLGFFILLSRRFFPFNKNHKCTR